jgi:hypothetical protein
MRFNLAREIRKRRNLQIDFEVGDFGSAKAILKWGY